jgi:lipopolysaccharide export system protein LptC
MDTIRSGTSSGISDSEAIGSKPIGGADTAAAAGTGQITDHTRRMAHAGGGYSHFVKFMKVVLPLLAFGIIGLLAAWPRIQGGDQSSTRRDSGELEMMRALYVGTDTQDRPFSLTADRAVQSTSEPGVLDLVRPQGELTLKDGTWIAIKADRGRYNDKTGKLLLLGNANLFHDKGYEFKSDEAHIDVKAGNAWGDLPVTGQGPFGEIFSRGFRLFDSGATIVFNGPAHLDLAAGLTESGGPAGSVQAPAAGQPTAQSSTQASPAATHPEIPEAPPTVAERPAPEQSLPEQVQR